MSSLWPDELIQQIYDFRAQGIGWRRIGGLIDRHHATARMAFKRSGRGDPKPPSDQSMYDASVHDGEEGSHELLTAYKAYFRKSGLTPAEAWGTRHTRPTGRTVSIYQAERRWA